MSLDNIQLPPFVLQDLFKDSLVELVPTGQTTNSPVLSSISFLGNNQKNITILVNVPATIYLPDDELNFLMGILTACQLSMADIALVNLSSNNAIDYNTINDQLTPEKILLFGIDPLSLLLPLQFPYYQVQPFNNQVYLSSPALNLLQTDKAEKTKLWNCLKKIFLNA